MSRVDENREVLKHCNAMINDQDVVEAIMNDTSVSRTVSLAYIAECLLDISVSLAVIADSLGGNE